MISLLGGSGSSSARISGLALYGRYAPERIDAELERFSKRPNIKRQVDEFYREIENIKTPEDFFKNYKVMRIALSAYGMESEMSYPARIKQVMMSDPDNRNSVANRMLDERYRQLMVDFGFVKEGMSNLQNVEFQAFLTSGFVINEFEKDAGQLNPAVTEALYFKRNIGKMQKTSDLYGNIQLFDVVKETLAIPNATVRGDAKKLTERVESGFDVKRVQEPGYVDKFIKRYLAVQDMNAAVASGQSNLLGIFSNG